MRSRAAAPDALLDRQKLTQSGSRNPSQSEALQSDPTNACGKSNTRKADHVEKRDPRSADNKRRKHMKLDNNARLENSLDPERTFDVSRAGTVVRKWASVPLQLSATISALSRCF